VQGHILALGCKTVEAAFDQDACRPCWEFTQQYLDALAPLFCCNTR
jgi:hypothetical protein